MITYILLVLGGFVLGVLFTIFMLPTIGRIILGLALGPQIQYTKSSILNGVYNMLIIKAFINDKEIDEIYIWNTGKALDDYGIEAYEYKILKPEGFEGRTIYHVRSDGYMALLKQAINIINPIGE